MKDFTCTRVSYACYWSNCVVLFYYLLNLVYKRVDVNPLIKLKSLSKLLGMSKFLILARCLRQTQFAPPAFPKRHIVAVSKDPWVHLLYLKKSYAPKQGRKKRSGNFACLHASARCERQSEVYMK